MNIESYSLDDWKVLVPDQSRLDAYVADEFKKQLVESIQDGTTHLILDLSGVEFMDSSGLGAIVYCLQRIGEQGRIAIAGAQEAVALMLRLTHIDRVFTLLDRPESVLQEPV